MNCLPINVFFGFEFAVRDSELSWKQTEKHSSARNESVRVMYATLGAAKAKPKKLQ